MTTRLKLIPIEEEEERPPLRLVEIEPEEVVPPKKRESQHLRQLGAGAIDLLGSIPAIAGLAEFAAIGVPKAGYRAATSDEKFSTALLDEFLNAKGIKGAQAVHEFANETMGVGEPEGLEQLTRFLPNLIPIGSGLVAKGASKAAQLLGTTSPAALRALEVGAQIATPLIQVPQDASTLGKIGSIALQAGIGLGADQGVRALLDQPTMFDEAPLKLIPLEDAAVAAAVIGSMTVGAGYTAKIIRQRNAAKSRDVSVIGAIPPRDTTNPVSASSRLKAKIFDVKDHIAGRLKLLEIPEEDIEQDMSLHKLDSVSTAQSVARTGQFPLSGVKSKKSLHQIADEVNALDDYTKEVFEKGVAADQEMKNRVVATREAIRTQNAEYRKGVIARYEARIQKNLKKMREVEDGLEGVDDPSVLSKSRIEVAKLKRFNEYHSKRKMFWEKYGDGTYVVGRSGKKYRVSNDDTGQELSIFDKSFSLDDQAKFLSDIEAPLIRTGLYTNDVRERFIKDLAEGEQRHLATDAQLNATINRMKNNPRAMDVVRDVDDFTSSTLDFLVERGRMSKDLASEWKRNATLGGLRLYVPGREATTPPASFLFRLRSVLGWNTAEANEGFAIFKNMMNNVGKVVGDAVLSDDARYMKSLPGNLEQQAMTQGRGITNPVQVVPTLEQYLASVIEHVNSNTARSHTLGLLASRATPDSPLQTVAFPFETFDPRFPADTKAIKETEHLRKKFIPSNQKVDQNQVVTIYENGTGVNYFVPDAELRSALDMHPHVAMGWLGVANKTRALYQIGTSRNIFFAIPQAMFSTILNSITAGASGIRYTPIDAGRGIANLFKVSMLNEFGPTWNRWFKDTAVDSPALQMKMAKAFEDSLFGRYMSETGGLHSYTSLQDAQTRLPSVMDRWSGALSLPGNSYGVMKGFYRYLSIMNYAIQDGPLWGLQMKIMEKELAAGASKSAAALKANRLSRRIAGDYTARNDTSGMVGQSAEAMRALFPFFGATLHGFRALGHAFKTDFFGTSARVFSYIIAPTIAEVVMTQLYGSQEQKDKYWKTDRSQIVSNFQIMTPDGKDFFKFAVEPMMRPLRAMTLELIDGIMGLSNNGSYKVGGDFAPHPDDETMRWQQTVATGFMSAFNIAPPPLLQAAAALAGPSSAIIGFDPNSDDPLVPGLGAIPLKGNQISAFGRETMPFPEGVVDARWRGVANALLGWYADTAINMAEQFNIGEDATLLERSSRALKEGGVAAARYSRVDSLFGIDEDKLSRSNEISLELRKYEKFLDVGANVVQVAGRYVEEPSLVPTDPQTLYIAQNAANLKGSTPYVASGKRVAEAYRVSTLIKSGDRVHPAVVALLPELGDKVGQPWTREMKGQAQDKLTRIIMENQLVKLHMIKDMERSLGVSLSSLDSKRIPESFLGNLTEGSTEGP